MKIFEQLTKRKCDLTLRNWMVVSVAINFLICLAVIIVSSSLQKKLTINSGFLVGLFFFMTLCDLYFKTNRLIWLLMAAITFGWALNYLF